MRVLKVALAALSWSNLPLSWSFMFARFGDDLKPFFTLPMIALLLPLSLQMLSNHRVTLHPLSLGDGF